VIEITLHTMSTQSNNTRPFATLNVDDKRMSFGRWTVIGTVFGTTLLVCYTFPSSITEHIGQSVLGAAAGISLLFAVTRIFGTRIEEYHATIPVPPPEEEQEETTTEVQPPLVEETTTGTN
jgi:hypothetical protein